MWHERNPTPGSHPDYYPTRLKLIERPYYSVLLNDSEPFEVEDAKPLERVEENLVSHIATRKLSGAEGNCTLAFVWVILSV